MCDGKNRKLKGVYSGYIDAGPDPRRLIDAIVKCDLVKLSVWATNDDATRSLKTEIAAAAISTNGTDVQAVDGTEIYWGFDNAPVHPLYPAQYEDMIPVEFAGDIFVECNPSSSSVRVGFSCFKYVDAVDEPKE